MAHQTTREAAAMAQLSALLKATQFASVLVEAALHELADGADAADFDVEFYCDEMRDLLADVLGRAGAGHATIDDFLGMAREHHAKYFYPGEWLGLQKILRALGLKPSLPTFQMNEAPINGRAQAGGVQ